MQDKTIFIVAEELGLSNQRTDDAQSSMFLTTKLTERTMFYKHIVTVCEVGMPDS